MDGKYVLAGSLIFANVFMQPLVDDIRAAFGTAFLYHPVTVWLVISCLVYVNTRSLRAAAVTVVAYEAAKAAWRRYAPEVPRVAHMRKILQAVERDASLDDEDVRFIDRVTPDSVTFVKTAAK